MNEQLETSSSLQVNHEPGNNDNPDVSKGRKSFIPLENNPEVLSSLVHKLGLSPALAFHDVFGIDDPDLLAFIPRPASALLLVFPISQSYEDFREIEDKNKPEYDNQGDQEPVLWFKQTIRNACGLIGVLHAVSNGESKNFIDSGSDLGKLVSEAIPLNPVQRADLIYDCKSLEDAHQDAAVQGQTSASAEDEIDLHYVCFIKDGKNNLWELDGRRKGPLQRGQLSPDEDLLSEKALDLSVRRFIKREQTAGQDDVRFSLIALAPNNQC